MKNEGKWNVIYVSRFLAQIKKRIYNTINMCWDTISGNDQATLRLGCQCQTAIRHSPPTLPIPHYICIIAIWRCPIFILQRQEYPFTEPCHCQQSPLLESPFISPLSVNKGIFLVSHPPVQDIYVVWEICDK